MDAGQILAAAITTITPDVMCREGGGTNSGNEAVMGKKNQSENRWENLFISPKWSAQMVQVGILFSPTYQQRTTLANEVGERERDHLNARDATPAPQ